MSYIADSLQMAPQGMYLSKRWSDIALVGGKAHTREKTADEIVDDIASRFGEGA